MSGSKKAREMSDAELAEAVRTGRKPFDDWAHQLDSVGLWGNDWREAAERLLADVERLRALWQTSNEGLLESETENTELGHEVERLRAQNKQWGIEFDEKCAEVERLQARIRAIEKGAPDDINPSDPEWQEWERLRAEVERLRAALELMAHHPWTEPGNWRWVANSMRNIARRALEGSE